MAQRVHLSFFGDSLAWEAEPALTQMLTGTGKAILHSHTYGGAALCDFLDLFRSEEKDFKPRAVIVAFSGNNLSACTKDPATGKPEVGDRLALRYAADAATVMSMYARSGATVYWVGAPISRAEAVAGAPDTGLVNKVYAALPDRYPLARFVDAGQAVLDHGNYTETLPCIEQEPCGPDGLVKVRAPDGAHFCPVAYVKEERCTVWSSGAFRYAAAIASPLIEQFSL